MNLPVVIAGLHAGISISSAINANAITLVIMVCKMLGEDVSEYSHCCTL